ncbi:SDR family oxidoreductase [Streptomyces luteolus]|uniref:SDR family oxidoreductase n=1 Tax=Streptomyces luteolus TaxID=3043615 RepID=A0ABT6SV64_9ACTN|nr:SDR family oxidoreductase [Streptomyces sp. B-S-A12]MDI3418512.1 SDR family oxidoreductase [Streptomyces sp. B-S-A12]
MTTHQSRPLEGATVVVIGGSSGMGLGVARSAAAQGAASVVVTSRSADRLPDAAARVTEGVTGAAPKVDALVCDLTDEQSIDALFDRVGPLDHLVVTASPGSSGSAFLDTEESQARAFVDGKLWGSWRAARRAALRMTGVGAAGRSITFATGGMSVRPMAGRIPVTVAFAGVEALARALAVELAPLRVNVIRPGMTDTEMWSSVPEDQRREIFAEFAKNTPARRVGLPEDIGAAATYAMTAGFVTGAVLDVDGGSLLT